MLANKCLTAKAWIDRHHQHVIHNVQNLAESLNRSGRINGDSRSHAMAANQLQAAVEMNTGFLMNSDPIRAGIGEGGNVLIGIFDHQVAVEGNIYRLAQARPPPADQS